MQGQIFLCIEKGGRRGKEEKGKEREREKKKGKRERES